MSFPPGDYLGWGLDMTALSPPTDIATVQSNVKFAFSVLDVPMDDTTSKTVQGITWDVPKGIIVSDDTSTNNEKIIWSSGTEAKEDLTEHADISAKYMAVSASADANTSIIKTFREEYQYYLFDYSQTLIQVDVRGWGSMVDLQTLKDQVSSIPVFNKDSPDDKTVAAFRDLFDTVGSHIITGITYGARLEITAWAERDDTSVNDNFAADANASFAGIGSAGSVDASIKTSDQFKAFNRSFSTLFSCRGGDSNLAAKLGASVSGAGQSTDFYQTFESWFPTAEKSPDVMRFKTEPLWDILRVANDKDLKNRSFDVQQAFEYVCAHPPMVTTSCTLTVDSDWGEIGLLTPSATFQVDDQNPNTDDEINNNMTLKTTKILFGKENSRKFEREMVIKFAVVNDGSPISIELSHGSSAGTNSSGTVGKVTAVIGKNPPLVNDKITDNDWNQIYYYGIDPTSDGTVMTPKGTNVAGQTPAPVKPS